MNRRVELLDFLYKKKAFSGYEILPEKLENFKFSDVNEAIRFLKNMQSDGYTDWNYKRPEPIETDEGIIQYMEPYDFEAIITNKGIEYIEERKLKENSNRIARNSLIVAGFAFLFSIVQWYSSIKKDVETEKDFKMLNLRIDSLAKSAITRTKQSLIVPSTKGASSVPSRHPLDAQRQQNRAGRPNNTMN